MILVPTSEPQALRPSITGAGRLLVCISGLLICALPSQSRAVDGCLVLLCFAAPNWSAVAQCVDPVRQVLHDLVRGRPFPSCDSAGASNRAQNA